MRLFAGNRLFSNFAWLARISAGVALLLVSITPAHVRAQELPSTAQGLTPYGSFQGGKIDSVILPTGKLNLHIPLVSYPQRGGKLHVGFVIQYGNFYFKDSKPKPCNPDLNPNCSTSQETWSLNPLGLAMGVAIEPDFTMEESGPTVNQNGAYLYAVTTPDESQHTLYGTSDGNLSMDATGLHFDSSLGVLTDTDGIRYSGFSSGYFLSGQITGGNAPTRIEDPNGNFLTGNPGSTNAHQIISWTDTLGRTIAMPGGGTTSDYSGCTGPLPTASAYNWSLPGANGGTVTFKVCSARLSITYGYCSAAALSAGFCVPLSETVAVIQSIVLPNHTAWTFEYDSTGDLTEIVFPTGGSISYNWAIGSNPCAAATTTSPAP